MDDLISRQTAIDALNEYFARIGKLKRRGLTKGEKAISLDTVGAIKTLPSAQPERKKGKWIHRYAFRNEREGCPESRECSCCGVWFDWDMTRNSFCPNCGADMRGEQDAEAN